MIPEYKNHRVFYYFDEDGTKYVYTNRFVNIFNKLYVYIKAKILESNANNGPIFAQREIFGVDDADLAIERLKEAFEPEMKVYPISSVTGEGINELIYAISDILKTIDRSVKIYEKEFEIDYSDTKDLPYTIEIVDGVYVVEGPRIEKMFGYTNLESEKGFDFFQKFLKTSGILDELEKMGIQDKDTVKMYGYEFDYYK